ncbi:hypothetical protein MINS_12330 [Mycolicibacterium insubricum]|uniref:Uncharacterized protein n=1 Tax=Mycolicibacterium insubricum TaxID=444597 RepID=A0A1X0CRV0_9MYCO|nr:hypothetical protein [Mycolicibacterium insubricum]MCV7083280.1 hypothetical protein [Mycolicibacterium insubricum]ORA62825.1 hypothetical protein BST26_20690 [Mycolicibacterium insubricum]BBZ65804.1 hypothetical protein MINS_12330 [Mycolicibacterium insubricum]
MTTTDTQTKPPDGLDADGPGHQLWASVTGEYRLRPDELRILENACRLADDIDYWEAEATECRRTAGSERTVRGSTGQRVLNKLLVRADKAKAEALRCRIAQTNMLAKLHLPDDPAAPAADQEPQPAGEHTGPRSLTA